ncbi:hypothetical protein FOZ62_003289, partial [Perkinsus olseni]
MSYPRKSQYVVSRYKLLLALFTLLPVAICLIPMYVAPRGAWYIPHMILGPIWAAVASDFNYQFCKSFSRRAITGVWIGATTGALVHYLISVMSGTVGKPEEYPRLWAVFLQLPFTFMFCMARGQAGCKLSDVFLGQHALIVSSIPTEFFTISPYGEDIVYAVSGTVGILVSFILITLLKLLHWLPSPGLPPFEEFSYEAADFYDVLTSYANSGRKQHKIVESTCEDFVEACIGITGGGGPKELYGPAWQMAGFLFSLRQVGLRGCYSDFIMEHYWDPLASKIFKLRSDVGAVLRNLFDPDADPEVLNIDLRTRARRLESGLLTADNAAERGYMEGKFEPPKSYEFMRFQFMIGSIMFFAVRTEEFKEAVLKLRQGKLEKSEESHGVYRLFENFADFWKVWWKKPFFNRTEEQRSIQPQLMFTVRFTAAIVVASVVLIIGGWYSDGVYHHARWAIVPLYVCFMPTVGSSLLRGTRRVLGTMAGAALGMICVLANAHDRAAVFVEAMVVGYVGKLASLYHPIEYAGRQFMNTWYVVCLDLALSTMDSKREMVIAAAWRLGLTTCGILYCTLVSGMFFPDFASDQMRLRSAHALSRAGKGVREAMDQLVASRESEDGTADIQDLRQEFGSHIFEDIRSVMSCRSDASAEIAVFGRMMLISDMSKRVFRNSSDLFRLTRYSLVLHNSLVSTTLRVTGCAVEILDPLLPSLKEFSQALEASRSRLVEEMVKPDASRGSPPPLDDINVTMQKCVDAFLAARRQLVKDALNGSDRAIRVTNGGGFR